jgi:GTPase SAR1 family protein
LNQFCQGRLPDDDEPHDPFFEQGCRQVIEIEGQNYMVDTLEMPSKHLWRDDVVQQAIHITEAAILVYDVTAPDSLRLVRGLYELIRDTIGTREYGLTLVGNKSDVDDEDRRVSWSEGSKLAAAFEAKCAFMEVSAKTGDNIGSIFPHVGREILKLKWINQQRKEQAENVVNKLPPPINVSPKHRGGIWKRIRRPFSRRAVATI